MSAPAPSGRFSGRRALVTGSSRGIGAAVARRLAAEGADVAITARTLDTHPTLSGSLRETAAMIEAGGGRAAVVVADLSDGEDRVRIVPEAEVALGGPIDILVNNAAAAIYAPLVDFSLKRRRLIFEINVHAVIDITQQALPPMLARGEGWIVNLSSATARPTPDPANAAARMATMAVYGASKAALNRLTNGLAVELAGSGVRVNTIEPRAAVMSEGAEALVGDIVTDDLIESMEEMVEATVALCDCTPERSGKILVSLDLIDELGLTVKALDASPLPRA